MSEVFRTRLRGVEAAVQSDSRSARAGHDDRRRADDRRDADREGVLGPATVDQLHARHGDSAAAGLNISEDQVHEGCDILGQVLKQQTEAK